MRTVVRNSFARQTIQAEVVAVDVNGDNCSECGSLRWRKATVKSRHDHGAVADESPWLYRFHVDDDQGSRQSGPIADGKLFCSRSCAESYIGRSFDECKA